VCAVSLGVDAGGAEPRGPGFAASVWV
jgi:hypothetical protein